MLFLVQCFLDILPWKPFWKIPFDFKFMLQWVWGGWEWVVWSFLAAHVGGFATAFTPVIVCSSVRATMSLDVAPTFARAFGCACCGLANAEAADNADCQPNLAAAIDL